MRGDPCQGRHGSHNPSSSNRADNPDAVVRPQRRVSSSNCPEPKAMDKTPQKKSDER